MKLIDKIKGFPKEAGVYLFKGQKGEVLYVGKAKNLRNRIKSYFSKRKDDRAQIEFLLRRTKDLDFIVTKTEKEALLLENTLIKENRPRYNISLRDDKNYISIKIDTTHKFPSISLTRKIKKEPSSPNGFIGDLKSRSSTTPSRMTTLTPSKTTKPGHLEKSMLYFGPYTSSLSAKEAVDSITRYFRVRSCSDTEFANRIRPCLKYDIGRCTAPCTKYVSREEYLDQVEEAIMFLNGKSRDLIKIFENKMRQASEEFKYEDAAKLRDTIASLKDLLEKQIVVKHGGGNHDAIALTGFKNNCAICVLKVRNGTLLDKQIYYLDSCFLDDETLFEQFILQKYQVKQDIPATILLSAKLKTQTELKEILEERAGNKIVLIKPYRGEMKSLIELASANAKEAIANRENGVDSLAILKKIGKKLRLSYLPSIIECLDISNLNGKEAVGSLVVFVDGNPDKSRYRIYNIQTLSTPDDYGMIKEVIERRFCSEKNLDRELPDILLIDGGKGQLGTAKRVIDDAGIKLPLAAIAKGEKKGHADQVFIPNRKNPLAFKHGSKELLLLMRIRDETHRFGINAHRKRRNKAILKH